MQVFKLVIVLSLSSLAHAADSQTSQHLTTDLSGEWATQGYTARVQIAPCADNTSLVCGHIVWLWDATDTHGVPLRDIHNPKAELQQRPLIGLPLLTQFRTDTSAPLARWTGGSIYDPESGRTYRATSTQHAHDALEVEGCVLFVCRKQLWRRTSSLCQN